MDYPRWYHGPQRPDPAVLVDRCRTWWIGDGGPVIDSNGLYGRCTPVGTVSV